MDTLLQTPLHISTFYLQSLHLHCIHYCTHQHSPLQQNTATEAAVFQNILTNSWCFQCYFALSYTSNCATVPLSIAFNREKSSLNALVTFLCYRTSCILSRWGCLIEFDCDCELMVIYVLLSRLIAPERVMSHLSNRIAFEKV